MIILTFTKFYIPGYRAGGPIRTLANMVDRLGDEFEFRIVTLDRDAGDTTSYSNVAQNRWTTVGKAQVMYIAATDVSVGKLAAIAQSLTPDIIYLNSFFDPTFTQRVLLARLFRQIGHIPVILAPRGEFSDGALRLNHIKKQTYLRISTMVGLYRDLAWQASSEYERVDIQRNLNFVYPVDIIEAIDLAPVKTETKILPSVRQVGAPLRVCFLSRLSPKKNLDFALRTLALVRADITFSIYGPKEVPTYWSVCESLIAELPPHVKVTYVGELHPSKVNSQLSQHDLFFFPTRGENYGHVIHEALVAGLPVLISDQTPWQGVVDRNIGWALPLSDENAFAQQIDDYACWPTERVAMVKRLAQQFAQERATEDRTLEANRMLFLNAAKRRAEKFHP